MKKGLIMAALGLGALYLLTKSKNTMAVGTASFTNETGQQQMVYTPLNITQKEFEVAQQQVNYLSSFDTARGGSWASDGFLAKMKSMGLII